LDGVKRRLTEDCLMIADSEKYLAVAGVMGGQNSEINSATKDIILEVANFKASSIRKASTVIALRSESSSRFEKSLDPRLTELALQKAVELILNLNEEAYLASSIVDIDNNPFESVTLEVPEDLINARFGQIILPKISKTF
jgi:phenylalanyl-tRNA synthetase beta chain